MKTILRKKAKRLFFQAPDEWTNDPHKAFNFKTIDRALKFIENWNLRDVEVAFAFPGDDRVKGMPRDKIALEYCLK